MLPAHKAAEFMFPQFWVEYCTPEGSTGAESCMGGHREELGDESVGEEEKQ